MHKRSCKKTLDCINYAFQAVTDHTQWQAVLELLASYVSNGKSSLTLRHNDTGRIDYFENIFTKTFGFSQKSLREYVTLFSDQGELKTPWSEIESKSKFAELFIFHEYLPFKELRETKLYTDWLADQNIRSGVSLQIYRNESFRIVLSVFHDEEENSSRLEGLYAELEMLKPHLCQAAFLAMLFLGSTDGISFEGRKDYLMKRYNLSKRETEVVSALVRLPTIQEAGESLFISENTVKFHIKAIKDKMKVRTMNEMMLRLFSVIDSGE